MRTGTRELLVRSAGELLSQEGLDAVTLRAVGTRAGVSRQAPYRHFADKDMLLAAVAAAGLRQIMLGVEASAQGARSPKTRLQAALLVYVKSALAQPALYALIFSPALADPRHGELHDAGAGAFASFRALLAPVAGDRTDRLAPVLWSTTHGVVMLSIAGHDEAAKGLSNAEAVVKAAVDFVVTAPRPQR